MFNPSALGVALLVLLATTTMVRSSPGSDRSFQSLHQSLSPLIANTNAGQMMGSYQRQTNTISLSRATLQAPHQLTISVPEGVTLQGTVTINGHTQRALNPHKTSFDLSPYLTRSITQVVIGATYSPASATVAITFAAPNTTVQQQAGGSGQVNYQLNLVVE